MAHPETKAEILAALDANARKIAEYFSALPARLCFDGDPDHWGPGHHLVHLTQTSTSVERALRSGALPPQPAARSRTYAEVRDAAAASLARTPKQTLLEMGRRVRIEAGASPADLVRSFLSAGASLREAGASWTEQAMDGTAITHPLIGVLTVREMLKFVVVHERHHLRIVQTRIGTT